jgi:hypothetical protein
MANISQINGLNITAESASYAATASLLLGSVTSASYAATASLLLGSVTSASYALTASLLLGSVTSASYAATASYVSNINQNTIYTKNSTTYSSSGTGTQILTSLLIPANTFVVGDVIRITARFKKVGTNGTTQTNILINTSVNTSGAITWKANIYVASTLASTVQGTGVIINATTDTQLPWTATNQGPGEYVNSTAAWQSAAVDWTANQYILFTGSPSSGLDTVSVIFYMIEKL